MAGTLSVTKRFTFEAAHKLEGYHGPCQFMHGHSYKLEVTVAHKDEITDIAQLGDQGMVMDFKQLGDQVKLYVRRMDHSNLNESVPIARTTAEGIIYWLAERLRRDIEQQLSPIKLTRIRLWETEDNYVEWQL